MRRSRILLFAVLVTAVPAAAQSNELRDPWAERQPAKAPAPAKSQAGATSELKDPWESPQPAKAQRPAAKPRAPDPSGELKDPWDERRQSDADPWQQEHRAVPTARFPQLPDGAEPESQRRTPRVEKAPPTDLIDPWKSSKAAPSDPWRERPAQPGDTWGARRDAKHDEAEVVDPWRARSEKTAAKPAPATPPDDLIDPWAKDPAKPAPKPSVPTARFPEIRDPWSK